MTKTSDYTLLREEVIRLKKYAKDTNDYTVQLNGRLRLLEEQRLQEKPKRKHKGWINIYPNGMKFVAGGDVHATEHEAKLKAAYAIATIQIEWED